MTETERGNEREKLLLNKIDEVSSDLKDDRYYRIWTDSQLIEIFIKGDSLNFGRIISFIFRIKGKNQIITKVHFMIDNLSKSESKDILKRIEKTSSVTITDEATNWIRVLDGNFFGVDRFINGHIYRKGYGGLFEQEMPEIKPIKDLFETLDKDYLAKRKDNFISSLSSGKFMFMDGGIILEKM